MREERLFEKIKCLPPEYIAEVEDFVDFLAQRADRQLVQATTKLSERSSQSVWDNEEDSVYDQIETRKIGPKEKHHPRNHTKQHE